MRRVLWRHCLAFLSALLLVGLSAVWVEAADPPWPAGLPWPATQPWPTPHPLQLGVPWSPGAPSYRAPVVAPYVPPVGPVFVPSPIRVAPPASPVPTSTPLPPTNFSAGAGQGAFPLAPAPANPPKVRVTPPTAVPTPLSNQPSPARVTVVSPTPAPIDTPQPTPQVDGNASPSLASLAIPGPAADGLSRATAFSADGSPRTMPAGGTAWFLIGSGSVHMDVWLDADPHLNVDLAIYAPDGGNVPVGRGTFDHANLDRLVWSGGNWNADGNWYALITNSNSVTLNYEIGSSERGITPKSCDSYWEYIGSAHVYWTKCQ